MVGVVHLHATDRHARHGPHVDDEVTFVVTVPLGVDRADLTGQPGESGPRSDDDLPHGRTWMTFMAQVPPMHRRGAPLRRQQLAYPAGEFDVRGAPAVAA